ncbi:MAG: hypothetical protein RR280_04340 [Bacteroidaceae bacterium]
MSVPTNPVRIYTSQNLGAQQLAGGALDLVNLWKQIVSGNFTDIQTISVVLSGTKAVITCADKHNLYPYQVVKLVSTGTALEGKEFFVLNDDNHTDTKFAIELGGDAAALPNAITIKLPSLGWDVVEDSTDWLSFRPTVDKRVPLLRISKTAGSPVAGDNRKVYTCYLARDVNLDGSLIKNYTNQRFMTSNTHHSYGFDQTVAWMAIADDTYVYLALVQPCYGGSSGNMGDYSFFSSNKTTGHSSPMVCYQYGMPTVLLEDFLPEWAAVFNGFGTEVYTPETKFFNSYGSANFVPYGYLNISGQMCFVTARVPFSFQGVQGGARSLVSFDSGRSGGSFPAAGAYGLMTAKVPLALDGGGYAVQKGVRCLLSNIRYILRDSNRIKPRRNTNLIAKDHWLLGLMELTAPLGEQPCVIIQGSPNGYVSGSTEEWAGVYGIRVGCSWKETDTTGV